MAILDESFGNNGKKGFLFTADRMYGSRLKNGPVILEQVRFAVMTGERDIRLRRLDRRFLSVISDGV